MNKLKIFGIVMFFGVIMAFGSQIGERLSIPGAQHLLPTAEARVGRAYTTAGFPSPSPRTAWF